jgi:hypothetical protein
MFFCAQKTTSSILLTKRVKFSLVANSKSSTFVAGIEKESESKKVTKEN